MGTRPDPEARPSANSILGAQIGRVRVGRLPTAPSQQTIISALLRGARAAGWELGTAREGLLLHPYPLGMGSGNLKGCTWRFQVPAAERGNRQRQAEGSGWESKGRRWLAGRWSLCLTGQI